MFTHLSDIVLLNQPFSCRDPINDDDADDKHPEVRLEKHRDTETEWQQERERPSKYRFALLSLFELGSVA